MNDNAREARAVRRMTAELAAEEVPELDWDRVERELEAKLATPPARHEHREDLQSVGRTAAGEAPRVLRADPIARRRAIARVVGLLAVAAALALIIVTSVGGGRRREATVVDPAGLPTVASDIGPAHPVAALSPGAIIAAADEPVRFTLPGVASWQIAPGSRVEVLTTGTPHEVRLDAGSIAAEVVPERVLVESFVVIAGETRVAVRGTSFTVTRTGENVEVEVRHGSVAVGPVAGTASSREHSDHELLIGPAHGLFSLRGKKLDSVASADKAPARADEAPARSDEAPDARPETTEPGAEHGEDDASHRDSGNRTKPSTAATAATTAAPTPTTTATPAVPPPDTKEPADRPMTAAEVRSAISSCAGTPASESPDSPIIVHSTITVFVDSATSRIVSVKFAHGAKGPVRQCALQVIGRTVEGSGTFSFELSVVPRN